MATGTVAAIEWLAVTAEATNISTRRSSDILESAGHKLALWRDAYNAVGLHASLEIQRLFEVRIAPE